MMTEMTSEEKTLRHQIGVSEQNARHAEATGRNPAKHEAKAAAARAALASLLNKTA